MNGMLDGTNLSITNYDATLIGWNGLPSLQNGVTLGANGLYYCTSNLERANIISTYGWTITDAALGCPEIGVFVGNDNSGTPLTNGQVAVTDLGISVRTTNINQVFAIENTGTAPLSISSITVSGTAYSIISAPTSVAVGATATFTLRLNGSSSGVANEVVTINNAILFIRFKYE
jgi:hypothetical protein